MSKLAQDTRGRHALLAQLDQKSQKQLADETGVGQPTLSLIAGRKRIPGLETAGGLAKVGIEYNWWAMPPTKRQLAREAERESARREAGTTGTDGGGS